MQNEPSPVAVLPTVLLIDDNRATNFLHARVLRKSGYFDRITEMDSAVGALEFLTTPDEEGNYPRPNLVLLDINMPVMNGWQFLEAYGELPHGQRADIILIMLTTSLNPDDRRRALQIDVVNGFQQKPLTLESVRSIIKQYFPTVPLR